MPANHIVIDEWLPHDIRGDNGLLAQQNVEIFLEILRLGNDLIIVLKESKWETKTWQLWNVNDTRVQILSKLLFLGILIDPLKCRYLLPHEIQPLAADLAEQVPLDDIYLFQSALSGSAQTIVTTDGRLIDAVTNAINHGLNLIKRDDHYHSLGM